MYMHCVILKDILLSRYKYWVLDIESWTKSLTPLHKFELYVFTNNYLTGATVSELDICIYLSADGRG